MAEQIIDGKGRGYRVAVNSENFIMTNSVSVPMEHHIAHSHAKAFTSIISVIPTGAGSIFCYMQNTNNLEDLCITKLNIRIAANDFIEIYHTPTGTPGNITNLSSVNNNIGSGIVPDAIMYYSTNITGLTNGTLIKRLYVPANNMSNTFYFDTNIVIPNNRTIFMKAGNGANQIDMNISFNFHSVEV